MDKKQKTYLGIGVIVLLTLYLGAQSFSNSLSFYYEVSELVENADSLNGKIVNVNGSIVKGSTIWEPETATLTFKLTDNKDTITVVSTSGIPGNYKEDIPAVAKGYFVNNTFQASQIITKCPSKYGSGIEHGEHNET